MSKGIDTQVILDAIPLDKWVSAKELGKITGFRSQKIGVLISFRLINTFVERRSASYDGENFYEYRRLMMIKTDMQSLGEIN